MYSDFPVVGPYDTERTVDFNAEDTINWYVLNNQRGKKPQALAGTPGLKFEFSVDVPNRTTRQLIAYQDYLFIITGQTVSYINQFNSTPVFIGNLVTLDGYVDFAIKQRRANSFSRWCGRIYYKHHRRDFNSNYRSRLSK